jgi:hypothetical protein
MADDAIWTSQQIVGAVIATGLVSGGFREALDWLKGARRKRRELDYLSVSVAASLEAFAIECDDLHQGMEAYYENYKAVGSISIPAAPEFPKDCDWRLVEVTLLNELLTFGNRVRETQAKANFTHHFEGDVWSHASAVKELGERAAGLAERLRSAAGLPVKQ